MMRTIIFGALLMLLVGIAGLIITLSATNVNELHPIVTRQLDGDGPIRSIAVLSLDTDIVITPSPQKTVTADLMLSRKSRADLFDLKLSERGGAVTVRVERKRPYRFNIGMLFYRERVEIHVPASRYELLRAESESADIMLENVESDRLIASADKGNIRIEAGRISGDIRAESEQGDVSVVFGEDPASLQLSFASSGEGRAAVDWPELGYSKQTENRLIGRSGSGKYRLDVKVGSGDFHAALSDEGKEVSEGS